jgi:hypothetical protein
MDKLITHALPDKSTKFIRVGTIPLIQNKNRFFFQNPNAPSKPKKTRIAPELSELVIYCQSVPFTGSVENDVINFLEGPCTAMSSFNETKARGIMVEKNRLKIT